MQPINEETQMPDEQPIRYVRSLVDTDVIKRDQQAEAKRQFEEIVEEEEREELLREVEAGRLAEIAREEEGV